MDSKIVIPIFREMGFLIDNQVAWPSSPVQWSHHPKIHARAIWGHCVKKVILYVPAYWTPGDRLRVGYYEPKHEIVFSRGPGWQDKAMKWLRGTGWKHANAALDADNLKEAKQRGEEQSRQRYAKELVDAGFKQEPAHSWRISMEPDSDGVLRPRGMEFAYTIRGTPKEVVEVWDAVRGQL